jgi:hypothetical protein
MPAASVKPSTLSVALKRMGSKLAAWEVHEFFIGGIAS